eukprot:922138-Pyramimonas_sp.AAC.1
MIAFGGDYDIASAKLDWAELAESLFKQQSEDGKAKEPKDQSRLKVWHWVCVTDHTLHVSTGRRRADFVAAKEEKERPADPHKWPSIAVSMDQGGDGWSACHF